jgi:mesencephalic astrocyte-derived neurotrophic factor
VARPVSIGMPFKKACEKLSATNPEICEVKFEQKVDLSKTNFKKMRVKQLKGLLSERGATCNGCTEKADFIKKVKQVLKDEL